MWASKTSILSPDFSRYLFVAEVLRQMAPGQFFQEGKDFNFPAF
jgi:hypothetical protein